MRHIFSLILALATAVSASALTPEQMNDRACENLIGPVKEVVTTRKNTYFHSNWDSTQTLSSKDYLNGTNTMRFNRAGYLISKIYSDGDSMLYTNRANRKYHLYTSFIGGNNNDMQIQYGKRKRVDKDAAQGDCIEYTFTPWGLPLTADFDGVGIGGGAYKNVYEKSAGRFPVARYASGSGVDFTVLKYRYLEFDSHGNWTKREVTDGYGGCTQFDDKWELSVYEFTEEGYAYDRPLFTIKQAYSDPRTEQLYVEVTRYTETRTITYY